jgi:hypothetical protein
LDAIPIWFLKRYHKITHASIDIAATSNTVGGRGIRTLTAT